MWSELLLTMALAAPVVELTPEGDTLVVSPIFEWFHRDFVFFSAGMDLCELTATYATDNKRRAIDRLAAKGCKVRTFPYDWSLNDAAKR